MATALTCTRRDLPFSSPIFGGFAAQHTGAVHWRGTGRAWYRSPERTLSVSISPDGDLHYAAPVGTERICGTETFGARMPQMLIDLIAGVVERATELASPRKKSEDIEK